MFYVILMGIISLFIAIFALQNAETVEISFLFWDFSMSLALIIIGCLLLGFILASLWTLKVKAGHFMKDRKLKGQIKELEKKEAAWKRSEQQEQARVPQPSRHYAQRKHSDAPRQDTDPIIRPFRPEK